MIVPFGNYAKIEVTDEYKGLARNNASEVQHQGILRAFQVQPDHLTESGGYSIERYEVYNKMLEKLLDKTVLYQEHSDSGRKFTENGIDYVMIPWYRIYGFDEGDK
jgi:hypothetical protein